MNHLKPFFLSATLLSLNTLPLYAEGETEADMPPLRDYVSAEEPDEATVTIIEEGLMLQQLMLEQLSTIGDKATADAAAPQIALIAKELSSWVERMVAHKPANEASQKTYNTYLPSIRENNDTIIRVGKELIAINCFDSTSLHESLAGIPNFGSPEQDLIDSINRSSTSQKMLLQILESVHDKDSADMAAQYLESIVQEFASWDEFIVEIKQNQEIVEKVNADFLKEVTERDNTITELGKEILIKECHGSSSLKQTLRKLPHFDDEKKAVITMIEHDMQLRNQYMSQLHTVINKVTASTAAEQLAALSDELIKSTEKMAELQPNSDRARELCDAYRRNITEFYRFINEKEIELQGEQYYGVSALQYELSRIPNPDGTRKTTIALIKEGIALQDKLIDILNTINSKTTADEAARQLDIYARELLAWGSKMEECEPENESVMEAYKTYLIQIKENNVMLRQMGDIMLSYNYFGSTELKKALSRLITVTK